MILWKKFLTSVNAFIDNPLKFLVDPTNTVLEYQTKTAVESGTSVKKVEETLQKEGFTKGSPVLETVDMLVGTGKFLMNNLPLVLFIVLLIVAAPYILPFWKKT